MSEARRRKRKDRERKYREALAGALMLLEWEGDYDEAMQWRDWQTCDILLDDQGRCPVRDDVIVAIKDVLPREEAV